MGDSLSHLDDLLLKIYFCFAWQNRLGLCAAVKISSEVN